MLSLGASEVATDLQATYKSLCRKVWCDNADYLMGIMGAWQSHYQRAAYVDMGIGDGSVIEQKARDDAANRGWAFEHMQGNSILIKSYSTVNGKKFPDFKTRRKTEDDL